MTRTAIAYRQHPHHTAGQSRDLEEAAATAGLALSEKFADPDAHARDGLGHALRSLAAGAADTLFVTQLREVASSLGELLALIDWLDAHEASLVAADVGFDSIARSGRRSLALLREIDCWAREDDDRRPPRGRPGLRAGAPELAERIAERRERGLSLRAIAEELNAEGIPTVRGGSSWRPSSVQAALGYRRPRPPAPGAPPPLPGPKGPGKHSGGKGPGHKPPRP